MDKIKLIFIPCRENQYRPEFLNSDFLTYSVLFLLILKLIIIPFFIYFPRTSLFADITKTALINLVNSERRALGIEVLEEDSKLESAAYLKAKDMIEKDYFDHQSPEGKSPWYWFEQSGYDYRYAGENLGIGFLDSSEIHQAWLNSISHKENLLNPDYKEIGIGIAKGDFQGNETTVVVQLFGSPQKTPSIPLAQSKPEEEILPQAQVENSFIEIEEVKTGEPFTEKTSAKFFQFLYFEYDNLIEKFIYALLVLIIASLIINVLIKPDTSQKGLILKTIIFILLLSFSIIFDKEMIIQLIPHNLYIL